MMKSTKYGTETPAWYHKKVIPKISIRTLSAKTLFKYQTFTPIHKNPVEVERATAHTLPCPRSPRFCKYVHNWIAQQPSAQAEMPVSLEVHYAEHRAIKRKAIKELWKSTWLHPLSVGSRMPESQVMLPATSSPWPTASSDTTRWWFAPLESFVLGLKQGSVSCATKREESRCRTPERFFIMVPCSAAEAFCHNFRHNSSQVRFWINLHYVTSETQAQDGRCMHTHPRRAVVKNNKNKLRTGN